MKQIKRILKAWFVLFFIITNLQGQNTIQNVLENSVNSLNLTLGTVINVENTSQFKDAINTVNRNGGNATILLADGIYPIASPSWYPYITGSNIVIRSASGKRDAVIITGGGMRKTTSPENGFYFTGGHITVADLTIKEVGNHAIALHGDHFHAYNVRFQNTYEQMLKGTSAEDGADNGIVEYCLFEYLAETGPQFYIGGIDVHKGNDWTIKDNVFRNIRSPSGSVAEHAIHFWNHSENITVERNLIINCDRGIGFGLGDSPAKGGIIRNNMIYNDGKGLYSDVGIGLENSPGTKVLNNTIFLDSYDNAIEYRFASTKNVSIYNNLTNKQIRSRNGGEAIVQTNITNATSDWFINPSTGDLRLISPVENVTDGGSMLSPDVSDDIFKTPRPQGKAYDIGAHELLFVGNNPQFSKGSENNELSVFTNLGKDVVLIKLKLKNEGNVLLAIYDINGKLQKTIAKQKLEKGIYNFYYDISLSIHGLYFVGLKTENETIFKKAWFKK
jgi:hypothetical protein